ncbi:c-type cytochrome [Arenimonas composti]|uniref:Cytochrome c, diheme subunit of cytochrome bc complex peta n=1 Tax=Arenimonas composti TR7-09 = DSM 18010 TaxID=1121013 RepID=A0A091BD86_9GAMM|nr:c-type cytochrome [Arenimonas composti]KFN49711.1 hypothetical protein P873_09140 [Arenimonas composti TR7-09 = DSM 18010]
MPARRRALTLLPLLAVLAAPVFAQHTSEARATPRLAPEQHAAAAADYQRYCALCHGPDRAGHANDHAPSLRSRSLLESAQPWLLREAIAYGRPGTAMAGFVDEIGGPMTFAEIERLNQWLVTVADVDTVLLQRPAAGDAGRGAAVYAENCASCHGERGEGGTGTQLANAAMLALTPDAFLRHAIVEGRQDTPMPSFRGELDDAAIDDVVAFLRSRGSDWTKPVAVAGPPALSEIVLNPEAPPPQFALRDGLYVSAAELAKALQERRRMVLLDTRVPSVWRLGHIAGAAPLPFYSADEVFAALPSDGTWIVAYCECPRAAAESVVRRLRSAGFVNTAVLYEGIQGWVGLGHPIVVATD